MAARRNAAAARLALGLVFELMTRPPVMRLLGLSPSQDAKCLALGHFVMSVPTSLVTFRAVKPSTPSIRVRSTPRHPVQLALDIKTGRVSLIALFAIGSRRLTVAAVFEPLQLGFNLPVALGDLAPDTPGTAPGLGSTRRCAPPASAPAVTWRWSPRRP